MPSNCFRLIIFKVILYTICSASLYNRFYRDVCHWLAHLCCSHSSAHYQLMLDPRKEMSLSGMPNKVYNIIGSEWRNWTTLLSFPKTNILRPQCNLSRNHFTYLTKTKIQQSRSVYGLRRTTRENFICIVICLSYQYLHSITLQINKLKITEL